MTDVEEKIRQFFADGAKRQLDKGELLLMPDTASRTPISYLLEGQVVEYDISDEGNRLVLNVFKPGAFFPLPVAINKSSVEYFFEAATPITVSQKSATEVEQFLRSEPEVAYDALSRVFRGVDGLLGRVVQLLGGNARGRVCYELDILSQRFGVKIASGVEIAVTASQLAEMTGLTRETVSRTLKVLQQEGLVKLRRGVVTLLG